MRMRDRIRTETAVQRVGWWLDWKHFPGKRRRAVLRELRASLADAAAAGELEAALARLGPPRQVAEAYLEDEPTGVRWRAGATAAALAYGLVTWLVLAFMIGFAEGAQAVGPEVGTVYETGRGLVVGDRPLATFAETEWGFTASAPFATWPHLALTLLAFALVGRPWRALRTRTRAPVAG